MEWGGDEWSDIIVSRRTKKQPPTQFQEGSWPGFVQEGMLIIIIKYNNNQTTHFLVRIRAPAVSEVVSGHVTKLPA